ncbi:MAG TPA: rhomboid family intramembrane serine protease [Phycisphaerae bacterium]|nr:rhomboid family intramembrane serine protease [Phycisphaerae bacterium]
MATCPRCAVPLVRLKTQAGTVYHCPRCGGRNAALAVLRKAGARPRFLKDLWITGLRSKAPSPLRCPHCNRAMASVEMPSAGEDTLRLDLCSSCQAVWFDAREFETVPVSPPPPTEPHLPVEVAEQLAVMQIKREAQARAEADAVRGSGPAEGWKWVAGILGLPVEFAEPERRTRPWMTWGGAGLLMVVFLATLPHLEQVVQAWGFVPQLWDRHWGLTLLTSFFLHGGVFHLLSNLYFFVIFGDNVEDHLGPLCFVLLLLGAEVFGSLTHAALDPRGDIPAIGASGGISGILGYYAATFPRARVGFFWFFPFFRWIHLPAWVMLLLFSLLQLLGAWIQMYGGGGVSYAAHLGGLAVGVAVALSVRWLKSQPSEFA